MSKRDFNTEEIKILKELFNNGVSIKEIIASLHRRSEDICYEIKQLELTRDKPRYHHWNREDDDILRKHFPYKDNKVIAELLNITTSAVRNRASILSIIKSEEYIDKCKARTLFRKNNIPANKGKKQTEYLTPEQISRAISTRFKKGHPSMFKNGYKPANIKSIGYTRLSRNRDGYVEIRVNDHNKNFVLLHHLVWEQKYGPIPKGYIIKFKDGDRMNCNINNLYMTSMSENMKMNSCHNYPKEISDLIHLKGALNRQINKVEKNGNK